MATMTTTTHGYCVDGPHALSGDKVLEGLQSSMEGLSDGEAAERLAKVGLNRLPEPVKDGVVKRFFKHFHNILIYILLGSAVITGYMAISGHGEQWIDTGVILGVVIINAIIGFIQEGKAEKALEGIRKMLALQCQAMRDGEWAEVEADALVPGDIVRLGSGDRVPADMRLLECTNLRIEESALTGESSPAKKDMEAVDAAAGVGDRQNMAYAGTLVTSGRGLGVVSGTGLATELGKINEMIAEVEEVGTPLTRQMNRFGQILSVLIVGLAVVLFAAGRLLHGMEYSDLFLAAIGFAVAAIPEGLPAILTITLALGVGRMAKRNAITRNLTSVETLGSVTVICSDKTGTLTKNEMTARHVVTRKAVYDVSGTGYGPDGEVQVEGEKVTAEGCDDLRRVVEVMAGCNDAVVVQDEGQWKMLGLPTEGALRTLAVKAGFDDEGWERVAVIPFESDNKFMATVHRRPDGSRHILLKGAPDRLLARCGSQYGENGDTESLDMAYWESKIAELSGEGLRVLAAATREAADDKETLELEDVAGEMIFAGLVAIIDPPRPEAIDAIAKCHKAGIRVKMITGDHLGTAVAIGKEMGLNGSEGAITGADIEAASDEELRGLAQKNAIFARTSPEHKLRLVKALQAGGEVVAMTGDGVNDAPALKRADVGVAMGIKGTEATKEAADIVLADDNFSSIERAVEEGRTIYDNLLKAIVFVIPTNGAESLVVLTAILFGLPSLPITPVQILWVNMVTAVTLAMALSFEPAEPGVMKRPPREPNKPILGGMLLWRIGFVSVLIGGVTMGVYLAARRMEMTENLARTLAVNVLVFGQIFYLFNSRYLHESSFRLKRLFANRAAWVTVAVLLVLQAGFVYLPFMQAWFGSASMNVGHWLIAIGMGALVFVIVEIEKAASCLLTPRSRLES